MSSRPHSLNEVEEPIQKIRRDQFKKIKLIVDTNAKFPLVAIGLVKDYCKGIESVRAVNFTDDEKEIRVWTKDTTYFFNLKPNRILETPTL